MKSKKLLVYLVMVFCLSPCKCFGHKQEIEIFYIPIDAQTYAPITRENIDDSYYKYAKIKNNTQSFEKIKIILVSKKIGIFNNKIVRIKMVWNNSIIFYIDQNGGVMIRNDQTEYQVDKKSLKVLDRLIDSITKLREL